MSSPVLKRQLIKDRATWNDLLRRMHNPHILQSWEWGDFKAATTGWQPLRWAYRGGDEVVALASVGLRRVGPLALLYPPKGPALLRPDSDLLRAVLADLEREARQRRALWLKIDPDIVLGTGVPSEADATSDSYGERASALLRQRGWRFSSDQVQFRNTIQIDLTRSEDELLATMSQNTRRKVRQAEKKEVRVRLGTLEDLPLLYQLYQTTAARDGFLIRPADYYLRLWRLLMEAGFAQPLIAEYDGRAIAHVILFIFGPRCWYFYGASDNAERERMPNYLLQWEAMRWARQQGCTLYDLWGAPDDFVESDSMWGVYEFKRGFRGTVTRHIGAWDYAPWPLLYQLYTEAWPRLRALLRR